MKLEHAHEASALAKARDDLFGLRASAASRVASAEAGHSLRISVYEGDESGGVTHDWIDLPLTAFPDVLPHIEAVIDARLAAIGVLLPLRPSPVTVSPAPEE